ncbi:hypothetical protein B0H34DRAFT_797591 [Crassisporium funariophilum]|nr:hypothetical protein B0H34DRAFT_797591 [Crassisporium funariophilum]
MGKSAKVHKRVSKKLKSASTPSNSNTPSASSRSQVQTAKKRASLKEKTSKDNGSASSGKGVLGGADYVSLLMGGRRKAREEAGKLPQEDS